MPPEASEAVPLAPALERTAPPGASSSGAAESEGRAPLCWPFRTREQQARAQQRAAEAAKSESEPESEMESENESSQSADGRERDEQVESDSGELSQQSIDAVLLARSLCTVGERLSCQLTGGLCASIRACPRDPRISSRSSRSQEHAAHAFEPPRCLLARSQVDFVGLLRLDDVCGWQMWCSDACWVSGGGSAAGFA